MTEVVFDARSTADDVLEGVDVHGKTMVITGSISGMGFEAIRALASHGACVVIAAHVGAA